MTRKEQIIEILKKELQLDMPFPDEAEERVADAILSLPLDVPSDEEIINEFQHNFNAPFEESYEQSRGRRKFNHDQSNRRIGAKWAINEILKRNGK